LPTVVIIFLLQAQETGDPWFALRGTGQQGNFCLNFTCAIVLIFILVQRIIHRNEKQLLKSE